MSAALKPVRRRISSTWMGAIRVRIEPQSTLRANHMALMANIWPWPRYGAGRVPAGIAWGGPAGSSTAIGGAPWRRVGTGWATGYGRIVAHGGPRPQPEVALALNSWYTAHPEEEEAMREQYTLGTVAGLRLSAR